MARLTVELGWRWHAVLSPPDGRLAGRLPRPTGIKVGASGACLYQAVSRPLAPHQSAEGWTDGVRPERKRDGDALACSNLRRPRCGDNETRRVMTLTGQPSPSRAHAEYGVFAKPSLPAWSSPARRLAATSRGLTCQLAILRSETRVLRIGRRSDPPAASPRPECRLQPGASHIASGGAHRRRSRRRQPARLPVKACLRHPHSRATSVGRHRLPRSKSCISHTSRVAPQTEGSHSTGKGSAPTQCGTRGGCRHRTNLWCRGQCEKRGEPWASQSTRYCSNEEGAAVPGWSLRSRCSARRTCSWIAMGGPPSNSVGATSTGVLNGEFSPCRKIGQDSHFRPPRTTGVRPE